MSVGIEIWNLTRLDRVNWERFKAIELVLLGGLSVETGWTGVSG